MTHRRTSHRISKGTCSRWFPFATICLRLTRSYLDYAGIVQGSRPLCFGTFTIGALIDEIDRQFAPIAQSKQLTWESRSQAPEMVVVTDASRCQQIFGNLVSNAIKYTPAGGQVHVNGKVDTDSWTVVVADSGPGIPAEASIMFSSRSSVWTAMRTRSLKEVG